MPYAAELRALFPTLVLEVAGYKSSYIQKKVLSVLRTVNLEEKRNSYPPALSGGEQQRVAVARAIVGNPKIILADEPTGSLDEAAAGVIVKLIKKFHLSGATVIIATHDHSIIRRIKGRTIHLSGGLLDRGHAPPDDKPLPRQ